jgi:hypothetical protein
MSEHELTEWGRGDSAAADYRSSNPRPKAFIHNVQSVLSTPAAQPQSRPTTLLDRLSFTRTKSLHSLAVSDLATRTKAVDQKLRKERETLERKQAKETAEREKAKKRQESRERAQRHREEREEKKAREKKVKDAYGIRGFDPNAGMLGDQKRKASSGDERGRAEPWHEHEHLGGLEDTGEHTIGPRLKTGETWGVEIGRPVHHEGKGHFEGRHHNCGELYRGS